MLHERLKPLLDECELRFSHGFAVALHVTFAAPRYLHQTYPKAWAKEYTSGGHVMKDPTVQWGMKNTGWVRWSDLADPHGVLTRAADFGLRHGSTVSVADDSGRSLGSFASPNKPSETSIRYFADLLMRLHLTLDEVPTSERARGGSIRI